MSERLPSDSQISHYRILAKIGEGGMGEVYLAHDTKVDRKVALKILPADFADDESCGTRNERRVSGVAMRSVPKRVASGRCKSREPDCQGRPDATAFRY
jgi:serine/threonine protein kinase